MIQLEGVALSLLIGHAVGIGKVYHRTLCSGLHLKACIFVYIGQLHVQVPGIGIGIHGVLQGHFSLQYPVRYYLARGAVGNHDRRFRNCFCGVLGQGGCCSSLNVWLLYEVEALSIFPVYLNKFFIFVIPLEYDYIGEGNLGVVYGVHIHALHLGTVKQLAERVIIRLCSIIFKYTIFEWLLLQPLFCTVSKISIIKGRVLAGHPELHGSCRRSYLVYQFIFAEFIQHVRI